MILIDPYANAFVRNPSDPPPQLGRPQTSPTIIPGVGERKWEGRFALLTPSAWPTAIGNKPATTRPFDDQWKQAAWAIVRTFREQQRKHGPGPYKFQRESAIPSDTLPLGGYGNPRPSPWA